MDSLFRFFLVFCFLFGFSNCQNDAPAGKKVLAILDNYDIRSTHSSFFKYIEDRGYQVTFVLTDEKAELSTYGEWNYDHLLLFAPTAQDLAGIEVQEVLDFIDSGRNVLLTANSDIGDPIKEIASECNVEFDEAETAAIDHFNYDVTDGGYHTLLAVDPSNVADVPLIFGSGIEAPILFNGIGQDIEEDSSLLINLLSGYSSTFSHPLDENVKEFHVAGKKTSLVSALQARNNARVIFSGSLDVFSDKFFSSQVQKVGTKKGYEKSGNEKFAQLIVQWLFKEKGILRAVDVQHHRKGESLPRDVYTIKDDIEYSLRIEEWNGKQWIPFNKNDVQLEFVRIDPHVRTFLKNDGKGNYSVSFQLPDVYGVFTFKIEYTRPGYGFLTSITRVPVRPFRHNEYERFIDAAYPYYAGAFSMMAGLFIFSWVFLYHKS